MSLLPRDCEGSSPAPQFGGINSLALSLLYGPTLTFVPDYWENHSFDFTDLCTKRMQMNTKRHQKQQRLIPEPTSAFFQITGSSR